MDSLNKAFECENLDTLSDDEIINVFNENKKSHKKTSSKRSNPKKQSNQAKVGLYLTNDNAINL